MDANTAISNIVNENGEYVTPNEIIAILLMHLKKHKKYSDYEYYPKLKELLTQVSALLDFCNNPEGSFEQVKDTINNYKNGIRDLTNDLNYIFAEEHIGKLIVGSVPNSV